MSTANIRIDIVSDIVCPWCIIGYKRLEKALDRVADQVTADIHWHPFMLNPHLPEGGENLRIHLAKKYGTTLEDSIKARANLTQIGAELGFQFDYFDDMKTYNSFKAHQLLHYAREHNLEMALKLRLFAAFFGERKAVDQIDVLVEEARAVGLDADISRAVLIDDRYAKSVQDEAQTWTARGIQSVPTFVFNQLSAVTGAYEPEHMADILLQVSAPQ